MLFTPLQTTAPFFSNDVVGGLKLLGTVIVTAGIVGGILIRLVFHDTTRKQETMQRDFDGLGKRVNEEAARISTNTAGLREISDRLARHEGTVTNMVSGHAELKATVEAMRSQSAEQQRDILLAIQTSGQAFHSALTDLKVEVARQSERTKLGETLAEGFHEIADIMRNRDRKQQ